MNNTFHILRKWFIPFIQVQFFLSLVSLPIIIAWGLPFSLMTMVGNFIFAPFLTIFLLCSSLVFFTEILHIPNAWCIWLLEKVTTFWLWCLQWGSKYWLIGFKLSVLPFSIVAAILAILILQHPQWGKKETGAFLYTLLFCLLLFINKITSSPAQVTITCNKKTISIYNNNGKLTLIDNGGLGEKINPTSWVSYTLLNELTKIFGTVSIETIHTSQSKLPTLNALNTLCQEVPVEEIIFTQPHIINTKSKKYMSLIAEHCKSVKTTI